MTAQAVLAIDQGTTSSRALVFDHHGKVLGLGQQTFAQHYPADGWVEHAPVDLWETVLTSSREAIRRSGLKASAIQAIGITNQRETTLVWDRLTGEAVYPAIVWQDRRTADVCRQLKIEVESRVRERTGLLLDPYFSASKIAWILQHVEGARERAEQGDLLFGTVDTYLIWRLTGGRVHATDATNASRTLLFDIHRQCWDPELLALFGIPASMLPVVKDCVDDFGVTDPEWLGAAIPIRGVAGDQQAALIGQACFKPGMCKSTYGTGCFLVMNTGAQVIQSQHQLLSTVAYRLSGQVTYALEGSIFMAGATMQWLRDGIGLIGSTAESEGLATGCGADNSVYLVPAFTGLGAPHWDPHARGAIVGLTRDSGIAEIVTAGLQSVAYQTRDLIDAMRADGLDNLEALRVDGGMAINGWAMQFLSDLLQVPVDRPVLTETTALGAAYLAMLGSGMHPSLDSIARQWRCDERFQPVMEVRRAERLHQGWLNAVRGVRSINTP